MVSSERRKTGHILTNTMQGVPLTQGQTKPVFDLSRSEPWGRNKTCANDYCKWFPWCQAKKVKKKAYEMFIQIESSFLLVDFKRK